MKPSTSVKTFLCLILALICVTSVGCGPDFGEKIDVKNTEIYYKDGATKADAERLSKQLENLQFIDGKRKSVQLRKREDVWEFRMATGKGAAEESTRKRFRLYCLWLSSAFDGDEVEVHICNAKLETKAVVTGLRGKLYDFGRNSYFYQDVELDQVKNFVAIAIGTQLDTSTGFIYHLSKPKSAVEIRMTYPTEIKGDQRIATAAYDTAVAASNKLFGGKQVDVVICDSYFDEQATFSSAKKVATPTP